ncbi:MAG: DUF6769 family protein [Marinilabiliaceae bacterium]|nr:hypothetical protein [Bacteroidales bacterium]
MTSRVGKIFGMVLATLAVMVLLLVPHIPHHHHHGRMCIVPDACADATENSCDGHHDDGSTCCENVPFLPAKATLSAQLIWQLTPLISLTYFALPTPEQSDAQETYACAPDAPLHHLAHLCSRPLRAPPSFL